MQPNTADRDGPWDIGPWDKRLHQNFFVGVLKNQRWQGQQAAAASTTKPNLAKANERRIPVPVPAGRTPKVGAAAPGLGRRTMLPMIPAAACPS